MSPGDWAGVAGALIAVGVLAERVATRLMQAPAQRDTTLPPQPQTSQPNLPSHFAECYARTEGERLEDEVKTLRAEVRGASDKLIRIKTILELRQEERARRRHGGDDGSPRESGG